MMEFLCLELNLAAYEGMVRVTVRTVLGASDDYVLDKVSSDKDEV